MRALWLEDHQLIGDSLELLLQVMMPEISLDKARTVDVAVQLAQSFQYEVILLDWWLGDTAGPTTLQALREAGCEAPFIVVTADERPQVLEEAWRLGAMAHVSKAAEPEQLLEALRRALQVCQPVTRSAASATGAASPVAAVDISQVFPELTPRQADVFRCLMRGLSDKEIARELDVSHTTARTHVRAILQVVGANRRGEAVYKARSRGARVD